MATRRLAPPEVQPASFTWSKDSDTKVAFWLGKYPEARKQSAVIPLLWLAQKQEGWVSEPALRMIATSLEMPYIRVYEVATFYTMFHLSPVGKHHLQVCGTTPCMLRGSEDLIKVCKSRIGDHHHVTPDGLFSWEEMECMGACANAPIVAIHDYYHEDLTPESFSALIDDLAAGKDVTPGSAIGRATSAPDGGPNVLTDASLYDGSLAKKITLPNLAAKA
jgi:NADH-quinone oxidoreductase subunit E